MSCVCLTRQNQEKQFRGRPRHKAYFETLMSTQAETIATRFWLLESLLIRLGADGEKETAGQRIAAAKDLLPQNLFRTLMALNDTRSRFVHESEVVDHDFATRLQSALIELTDLAEKRAPLAKSMPAHPRGRVVIVGLVLSPKPAVRCTYLHIYNGSNQKLTMESYRAEVWDTDIGALLFAHRFNALNGTFDPGEGMCLIIGKGRDTFQWAANEPDFPADHWDIYSTKSEDAVLRMNRASHLIVQLLDESAYVVATLKISREHLF